MSGIKRHITVDTEGLPHAIHITTANVTDRAGAITMVTIIVIPKRWVVERSFAWLEKCRCLWKNCERKISTSLQMVVLAFIRLLAQRR